MNFFSNICGILGLIVVLMSASDCKQKVVPPAIEKPVEEKPIEPEKPTEPVIPIIPDGPYLYDYDMDYNSEEFLKGYKGIAFKENKIPGIIEAEDFDKGTNGVAYMEKDNKTADASYRGEHEVEIRKSDAASNHYYIGEVQPGEWLSYTVEVEEDGAYSIKTYIVKGDNSSGEFSFELDGVGATETIPMPQGGWEDFSKSVVSRNNINLTKGKHIIRYCASSPGNVDKFEFTKVGDIQSVGSNLNYPMTKQSSGNPLFVDFPSPMFNSLLTGPLYTADPSAHVWNIDGKEILYIYASHDMEPAVGCDRMDRYHVFSTEDMINWTDHGEIMNAATVRLQNNWGRPSGGFMWAPDCAYNPETKLYYFYFPHPSDENWGASWKIGVAVSKYPDKEFWVIGTIEGAPAAIDPCVFVDDDGQAYFYNGGGGKCYGGKLRKDDWTKLDGEMKEMTGLHDFHEATWIHKYNGKYYLSHSDNNGMSTGGNNMRYAVSDSPLGPWKDLGVYIDPTGIDTNHGSIVKFKGQWYAFYHCGDYSGHGTLRSVCVDKLTINADGTLQKVVQTRDKSKVRK